MGNGHSNSMFYHHQLFNSLKEIVPPHKQEACAVLVYTAGRQFFKQDPWVSWFKLSEEDREFFRKEARMIIYVNEGTIPRLENYQFWRFLAVVIFAVLFVALFAIAAANL